MWRKIRRGARWLLATLVAALLLLAFANAREAERRSQPINAPTLTRGQKTQIAGALRLQQELGHQVWPGLDQAPIPVILFNDEYEFLVGLENPPTPWSTVPDDSLTALPYHRRTAANPQSFAVPVGRTWAGSLGSLDLINRELLLNLRRDMPPVLAQLIPYPLATISPEHGQAALLHEMFHAYQAVQNPERFARSEDLFRRLKDQYPYADAAFAAAWDQEGRLLSQALNAREDAECRRLVTEFLGVRTERRVKSGLSRDLIAMEQEREWLEGLALYVEMRSHEQAAAAGWEGFKPGLKSWQTYFRKLDQGLGDEGSDLRFYPSGMAMARLLDRLRPDWKAGALTSYAALEELLAK